MGEREVPSLGGDVGCWIQDHLAIPDGDHAGAPFLLTGEQWDFLLRFYALEPSGEFAHRRGGVLVRPAKWGKGPFSAAIIAAEAAGPTRFAGWDGAAPIGKPPPTPWIQVAAVSEDQTANVWRALVPMFQLGDIGAEIDDVGLTRVNLPGGGRIEFVTAAHRSRVGQRTTFAVMDEAGFWLQGNHGPELADAIFRNLAGMGGRFLQTTNAWNPAEESVAQRTVEAGDDGVFLDDVDPGAGSIKNKRERRRMLRKVYRDSAEGCEAQGNGEGRIEPWIDLDRIEVEIESLVGRGDAAQAERFFLNRKRASEAAAFDLQRWGELAMPDHDMVASREIVRVVDGRTHYSDAEARVVIGVDGARFVDAIAVVATEVSTGYQFALGIWERPENASEDYEHPLAEVDGAMTEAFERFTVARCYVDPQYIEPLLDRWQGRWGDKRVLPWYTNRPRQMAHAVRTFAEALAAGDLSHDGDPDFTRHIGNATRRPVSVYDDEQRQMWVVAKDRRGSKRKVDAAVAAVISWEAMRDERQTGESAAAQGSASW